MASIAGFGVLSRDESLRLLTTTNLGRIAISWRALPMIMPVNFALDGDRIVVATWDGSIVLEGNSRHCRRLRGRRADAARPSDVERAGQLRRRPRIGTAGTARLAGRSTLVGGRRRAHSWSHDDRPSRFHGPFDARVPRPPSHHRRRTAGRVDHQPPRHLPDQLRRRSGHHRLSDGRRHQARCRRARTGRRLRGRRRRRGGRRGVVGGDQRSRRRDRTDARPLRRPRPPAVPVARRAEAPLRAHRARRHLRPTIRRSFPTGAAPIERNRARRAAPE